MDVQHAFIAALVEDGDIDFVFECGITSKFFDDDQHLKVWEMIRSHWEQHKVVPDVETIHAVWPNYSLDIPPEPFEYYVNKLKGDYKAKRTTEVVSEAFDNFDAGTAGGGQELYDAIRAGVMEIEIEVPQGRDENFYGSNDLTDLNERRKNPGYLRGIPTGFDGADIVTGGYQSDQLITLVGVPKAGKSTYMLYSALQTSLAGYRTLFFTYEMSIQEQEDRLNSMMSGVDINHILNGTITPQEYDYIASVRRKHSSMNTLTLVADPARNTTISAVRAKVRKYEPDIVFVDGVYMMDDELDEPKMSPRALTNLTQGFKRMAQTEHIAIVISTQALISKSQKGLNMGSVGYSSSFVMDSDVVFGVEPLFSTKTSTLSAYKVLAIRSGPKKDLYVNVDWSKGSIDEIDHELVEIMQQEAAQEAGLR